MKYWVYMNGEIPGSFEPEELASLPGFQETAMVCPSEGGIADRNWRRAGQFPDIIAVLQENSLKNPPSAPTGRFREPAPSQTPDDVLNDVSTKIFGHVSHLMKELENRREERALTQSLQRQMIDLKNELQALRERNEYLQERVDLLPGFQKRENKLEEKIRTLAAGSQTLEDELSKTSMKFKELEMEYDRVKKSEADLSEDLVRTSRLHEEISQKLADKELQLARSFGIISKLESMLGDILPGATTGMQKPPTEMLGDDVEIAHSPTTEEAEPVHDESAPEPVIPDVPEPIQEIPDDPPIESVAAIDPIEPVLPADPPIESAEAIETLPAEKEHPSFTSDTSLTNVKPDWPEEGEVTAVPPPWKVRLASVTDFVKKKLKGSKYEPPTS